MGVLNTTPRTWVSGEVVTAAELNTEVRDALTAAQAAWTAYVPTVGGITTTSGTLTGRYNQVGKTVDFVCQFTLGASSAVTGSITFTLPVTAASWMVTRAFSDVTAYDSSVPATYSMTGVLGSTTVVTVRVPGSPVTATGATVPFTWATGDIVTVAGRYEAA